MFLGYALVSTGASGVTFGYADPGTPNYSSFYIGGYNGTEVQMEGNQTLAANTLSRNVGTPFYINQLTAATGDVVLLSNVSASANGQIGRAHV